MGMAVMIVNVTLLPVYVPIQYCVVRAFVLARVGSRVMSYANSITLSTPI